MSDLIRREDVIQEFIKTCSIEHADINSVAIFYETIMKIINSVPSVELEQTAKVIDNVIHVICCEKCERVVSIIDNYCPGCGAKLDWSENE